MFSGNCDNFFNEGSISKNSQWNIKNSASKISNGGNWRMQRESREGGGAKGGRVK
jgi:hypothetical protein